MSVLLNTKLPFSRWAQSGGSSCPRGSRPFSRHERNASRWPPCGKWMGGLCTPSWPTRTTVPPQLAAHQYSSQRRKYSSHHPAPALYTSIFITQSHPSLLHITIHHNNINIHHTVSPEFAIHEYSSQHQYSKRLTTEWYWARGKIWCLWLPCFCWASRTWILYQNKSICSQRRHIGKTDALTYNFKNYLNNTTQ